MLFLKNNINFFIKTTNFQHKIPFPNKTFSTKTILKMPLVVPGINSGDKENSKTEEWTQKLVGKKIGESSDSTVSFWMSAGTFIILILCRPLQRQTSPRRLGSLNQE
jgi:hypothetical protein